MRSFEKASTSKDELRRLIPDTAKKYGIEPEVIFTLTGKEMLDIPYFISAFPEAEIKTVERNKNDFKEIIKKSKGRVSTLNATIDEYSRFNLKSGHHGIVFLDYLGAMDSIKVSEIKTFIQNSNIIHDKPTVLAITFQKGNRQGANKTLDLIKEIRETDEVENSIEAVTSCIWLALLKIKSDVIVEHYIEYKNSHNSVPMYFILLVIDK